MSKHIVTKEEVVALGGDVKHHFSDSLYVKEVTLKAGTSVIKHTHNFSHLSVLVRGSAKITVDGYTGIHNGYKIFEILAGENHAIEALTDITWLCIHTTNETDETKVDSALVSNNKEI